MTIIVVSNIRKLKKKKQISICDFPTTTQWNDHSERKRMQKMNNVL